MRHQIGLDYSAVLPQRKTKRELPLIGRLNFKFDFNRVKDDICGLLEQHSAAMSARNFSLDPASSEHNYNLKDRRGNSFIANYEEFYRAYSVIGFQELSEDARLMAGKMDLKVDEISPSHRLRGMKNTRDRYYHPHYDERNYTSFTPFCLPSIKKMLTDFRAEACRSALVVLHPGQQVSPHFDIGPEYITRVMVPIITNSNARIGVRGPNGWHEFYLPADGSAYFINSGWEHYAINAGEQSRYQIRICLNGQEDLEELTAMDPVAIFTDPEVQSRLSKGNGLGQNILKETLREFRLNRSGRAVLE